MKKYATILLQFCLFVFAGNTVFAQMVGDNVFLQGNFVEVGIAPNGGFGSTLPAPTGYHPFLGGATFDFYDPGSGTSTLSGNQLGFVADYGRDGWTVGTPPFFGDYFLPGEPQEGWAIEVNGLECDAYVPAYLTTGTTGYTGGMTGTNVSYSNSGGIITGVWQGMDGALAIRQTTTLDTTKLYFTMNVVLTNTGTTPLTNIYYLRTVDPDNEETRVTTEPVGTPFTTINTITDQLPNVGNKVLVSATGETFLNDYLGLGTKDCRARCVIFNNGTLTPDVSIDSVYNELQLSGDTYFYGQSQADTQDVGIGLAFNIGTIAPGDSTTLSYAYILNAVDIDSALNSTQPEFEINSTVTDSTYALNLCSYAPDSINVNFLGGGFYQWTFFPDSFVSNVAGTHFAIHSDSITDNISYTIIGANVAGGCDSIVYHLNLTHATFTAPALTPSTYCQDATAVPLTAPGTGLIWYTAPAGGGGSTTAPTPVTTASGTFIYYVTETIGLCQSLRTPDTVYITPLPVPPALSDPNPYCQGQTFVPISTIGTDILWYPGPTGGVGGTVAPTVNTGIPGTDTFYASQTVNGCEGPRQSLAITVLDSVVPSFTYVVHYGCKGDTVLFTNTSRGATRYVWQFGDGASDTTTNPMHVYLLQDTFSVQLTAITLQCNGSVAQSIPLVHPLQAGFTFEPNILCQKDTSVFTNTSIGTGLTYEWLFGNGATSDTVNAAYAYQNSGVYQVQLIATDFVPCHDTAVATISIDSISTIGMTVTDSVVCESKSITFTGNFTSVGNTGETWYFGNGDSVSDVNPITYAYDAAGTYTVSVIAHFRACRDTGTSHTFTVFSAPNISLGGDTAICPGSAPLVIGDNINNVQGSQASWTWNTGQTTPSISVVAPGLYYVTVNTNGCSNTDSVLVQNDCYMSIPNVFTPNGDGINDYFYPMQYLSKGITSFKMDLYNRWGQLIFEGTALDGRGWDGKFNGVDQPADVYVYVIDALFIDGQKEHHQGNVTLLR